MENTNICNGGNKRGGICPVGWNLLGRSQSVNSEENWSRTGNGVMFHHFIPTPWGLFSFSLCHLKDEPILSTSGFLKSLSLARHTFREYFFYPDNWEVKLYSYYSFMYFLPQTLSECVLCARHHATLLGTNTFDLFYLKSWRSSYWLPLHQALCSLTDDINDILAPHIIFKWKQKRGG